MNPCDACQGKCCQYFTLELFYPQLSIGQFMDTINWIERHEGVTVTDINASLRYCKVTITNPCKNS